MLVIESRTSLVQS